MVDVSKLGHVGFPSFLTRFADYEHEYQRPYISWNGIPRQIYEWHCQTGRLSGDDFRRNGYRGTGHGKALPNEQCDSFIVGFKLDGVRENP
jgi:hypothetical protein